MARRVDAADTPVQMRHPVAVAALAILTLGAYAAWWAWDANRELHRFGRARDRRLEPWIRVRPLVAGFGTLGASMLAAATWVGRQQLHATPPGTSHQLWQLWVGVTAVGGAVLAGTIAFQTFERIRTAQLLSGILPEQCAHPVATWLLVGLAAAVQLVGVPLPVWAGWAQRQLNRTWSRYDAVPIPYPAQQSVAAPPAMVAAYAQPAAAAPVQPAAHAAWPAPAAWAERPTPAAY